MRPLLLLALLVPAALAGCATQQTLDAQSAASTREIDAMKQAVERLAAGQQSMDARLAKLESGQALIASRLDAGAGTQHNIDSLRTQLDGMNGQIAKAQETAEDAVKIARDSRLVSGKIVDSLRLNESMISYAYEQPELTAQGRAALDKLIADVKPKLPHVFVEIIGYTDNQSLDSQNRRIALERAESVRRYLHETGGIPLDRMSTISYGDLKPIASNISYEGREQNRRVLVQVLK